MNNHPVISAGRRGHPLVWLCCILAAALTLAACGKTSSTNSSAASAAGSSSGTSSSASASASTGCGSVPTLPIHDASGVIAQLGSTYKTAYNGYLDPVFPSAFAHFKPKQSSGFTIGMVFTQPINSFQAATIPALQKDLGAIKGVSHVTLLTSPPTGVTTQIQQVNQLIQQHVSVIVVEPLVPQPFIPLAAKAEAEGIPIVSLIDGIPSKDAVSVTPNSVADGATVAATVAREIGSKGTVVGVHGIPGTSADTAAFKGFHASFSKCSGITFNTVVGQYQVPVTKQAVLTYLSSHPQPVAGAVQVAGMTPGIIAAFQQTGRPQPAEGDGEPAAGDFAYWNAHKSTFKAVANVIGPHDLAAATAFTVSHLLSGHGPKVSELTQPSVIVTAQNLSKFVVPGAGPTSPATVEGPAGSWMPASYLAPLFNK